MIHLVVRPCSQSIIPGRIFIKFDINVVSPETPISCGRQQSGGRMTDECEVERHYREML